MPLGGDNVDLYDAKVQKNNILKMEKLSQKATIACSFFDAAHLSYRRNTRVK